VSVRSTIPLTSRRIWRLSSAIRILGFPELAGAAATAARSCAGTAGSASVA